MNIEQKEEERRYREAGREEKRSLDRRLLEDPLRVLNPTPCVVVDAEETVSDVVRRMAESHQACVVVLEGDRVAGIFTERDVLTRVVGEGADARETTVADVMTPDPECLTDADTLGYALHKMSVGGYRHLPLLDETGRPTGIITQNDGMRYLVGFSPDAVINQPPRSITQRPPKSQYGG